MAASSSLPSAMLPYSLKWFIRRRAVRRPSAPSRLLEWGEVLVLGSCKSEGTGRTRQRDGGGVFVVGLKGILAAYISLCRATCLRTPPENLRLRGVIKALPSELEPKTN
mmetsp:Transcript_13269/g.17502  ORF Transcript_13269/g.17502 Transcript_13269/m.17502 type:complete len:109 (+) Transcript_13269:765-1091(+)